MDAIWTMSSAGGGCPISFGIKVAYKSIHLAAQPQSLVASPDENTIYVLYPASVDIAKVKGAFRKYVHNCKGVAIQWRGTIDHGFYARKKVGLCLYFLGFQSLGCCP